MTLLGYKKTVRIKVSIISSKIWFCSIIGQELRSFISLYIFPTEKRPFTDNVAYTLNFVLISNLSLPVSNGKFHLHFTKRL